MTSESRREIGRWSASAAAVIVCYAAAIAGVLAVQIEPERPSAAPLLKLALIELAPPPQLPEPDPQPAELEPPEPEPEPVVETPPEPDPPPQVEPEVTLPPPARKPKPPSRPVPVEAPPRPAPPVQSVAQAPLPPAPLPIPMTARDPAPPDLMVDYMARIVAHVQKKLRYPGIARARRQQGTSMVRLILDPSGTVVGFSLQKPSGIRALDEEALAVVKRAEPFPPMPPALGAERRDFILPVQFKLR